MKFERLLYLGYHLKKGDYHKLTKFRKYVIEKHGISATAQWRDVVRSSLKYNTSLDDYYLFRFYELDDDARLAWAGTGTMYEFQKRMNPPDQRKVLAHKPTFYRTYARFIRHNMATLQKLNKNPSLSEKILSNPTGKVVLKSSTGQCGNGIEVWRSRDLDPDILISRLKKTGNDMAEDFVQQHERLHALSPSGLNTVRIITQLDVDDQVHILGARLRITVNAPVDNLAAGNMAAPIDLEDGTLCGPGVYSDITKDHEVRHPVTGVAITGFQVPFWEESMELVREAALSHTGNRSIGWDVAVTDEGPELIEGNHDWCKLLWQLPVRQGLKPELDKYI